jgi:prepilin-type N-terminal cleavage/methylation domain-containing protein
MRLATRAVSMKTGRARGFTLAEVLTVIVLIGVLASIASPSFIRLMRDRGVSRATMQVMDAYRTARARSLERDAIVVRFSATGGPGGVPRIELYEAVTQEVGAPPPTCNATAWGPGSPTSRLLAGMNFSPDPEASPTTDGDEAGAIELSPPVFADENGGPKGFADVCFTARGKTWIRYVAGDSFTPLSGVPSVAMINKRTGFKRVVFIPPNSPARIAL